MRLKTFLAVLFAAMSISFTASAPASAFDWDRPDQPRGWDRMRTIRHWVYHPRYRHIYLHRSATDPYQYHYAPRGYYPYYNSMYWRPATKLRRAHNKLPPYYQAWGARKRGYKHVSWHRRHHGGHRRGDW